MSTTQAASSARSAEVVRARAGLLARDVLLRCWLRETGQEVTRTGPLEVELPATGERVEVEVLAVSPIGAHGLGVVLDRERRVLSLPALAGMLTREAAARGGGDAADALARIVESARRLEGYAVARAEEVGAPDLPRWLLGEQDLVSGHPWHPMTKSRDGLADELDARYAPEARGRFAVHWLAAAPEVAAFGGTGLDVPALMHRLAGPLAEDLPEGWLPVPAHPWQADDLRSRPAAAALLDAGLLRDLGPGGAPWWATSSLRTVGRPGEDVMLKLSMGLRVTNSRRENTRDEGRLAVHTAELVDAGLGDALAAAHPHFGLVLDRGWLGVDGNGPVGLETVLRQVPFDPAADVTCAGALLDPRPDCSRPPVAEAVSRTASAHGLGVVEAAELWLRRWLEVVVEPILWLHGTWGIGLEAHLQNVLVELDADGLPCQGWYRDNQGWYAAESAVPRLATILPTVGRDAPLVFADRLVVDRVAYYVGVNHVLGVAAAVAAATAVPEQRLLAVLAEHLEAHLAGPAPSAVAELLLHAPTLPTKANLLTGVDGRDEVAAPVETQSVYVEIPNPLREVTR
ncbi:siderophore biosynthesis protein [Nocardioides gansuensis]|uniref:Siderophore biosynthesis protein n=1 Tax=Nocardioides gansuensis TaxID=2138300 RepID=A0A2T8F8G4_9ACTN|nr:IucA/IucC family protein [Nocardioides gansuensis]PVG81985.1 siderophore biosynthesis protein [Nocardioides gansuensis]